MKQIGFKQFYFFLFFFAIFRIQLLQSAINLHGQTGALLTPSPITLEQGKHQGAFHFWPYQRVNLNGQKIEELAELSFKYNYGVLENFEVGIEKSYTQDSQVPERGLCLSAKYSFPKISISAGLLSEQSAYTHIYLVAGEKYAYIGGGMTTGPDYRFSLRRPQKFKYGRFGGYDYNKFQGSGHPDDFFVFLGGEFSVTEWVDFVYDFDGNRFGSGLRFNWKDMYYADLFFISDGDYNDLPPGITRRDQRNLILGIGAKF
ncbi:hypothetical protein ACFL35_01815 [Candidatus Riflebacteria bacterium]